MLITRRQKSTHWYLLDGTPFYEVPLADGSGLRPATIRDAMKAGAVRSVTNVLGILGKPRLVNWQIEQGIVSALTLPRLSPDETDHAFAQRVIVDSEAQATDAAEKGSYIHDLAADYLTQGQIPLMDNDAAILAPFQAWVQQHVAKCIYSETVVINPTYAYAGRLDAFVELWSGGYAVLDIKTQDMGRDKDGKLAAEYYPEWPLQLAAYAQSDALRLRTPANHKLISIVINRTTPGFGYKEWPADSAHFEAFIATCKLWSYFKKCTPGLKPAA